MDRSERRRRNEKFVKKGEKILREFYSEDYIDDRTRGRCRKTKALDCGRAKCGVCSRCKTPKRIKTRQEEKIHISSEEQIEDI